MIVLGEGVAVCVYEPKGWRGLEGYSEGESYRYQECLGPIRGRGDAVRYFRVYPGGDPAYYEVAAPWTFDRCFRRPDARPEPDF